jgi:site-specific DNA-cytosine methylase
MNELALFAGIGGGLLASQLLGHRVICAVENDPYAQAVLLDAQNKGCFPPFPIWDDVRTFDGTAWRGIVDLVSGGFPCQNISDNGDKTGIYGEHSRLWFDMLRIVCEVMPEYVFVENSNRIVSRGLDVVLSGLSESRFNAEWCVLGADDCGASQVRERFWLLAKRCNVSNTESKRFNSVGGLSSGSKRHSPCLPAFVKMLSKSTVNDNGGKLNPTWVEWLMGLPIGHTELNVLETHKYQSLQQWRSKFCIRD